jgi:cyclophilin family peptidyl-prolyl cis-trans isomerase
MKSAFTLTLAMLFALVICPSSTLAYSNPQVVLETNFGDITVELSPKDAPITVDNFLHYVNSGFYEGLLFHRVIENFMIQGGGYYIADNYIYYAEANDPIINESYNGLSNLRGTIAMARSTDPNSATSQFYINHADNLFLDRGQATDGFGYCVFGQVTAGMDVVDAIAQTQTYYLSASFADFPYNPMVGIYQAYLLQCDRPECTDVMSDSVIDIRDLAALASHWLEIDCNATNEFCQSTDLDYNGAVDFKDFALFATNWINPEE